MTRDVSIIAFIVSFCFITPAAAHAIVGHWCHPESGRRLVVNGVSDVTLGNKGSKAYVDQHIVDMTVPPGEPDAGDKFKAIQLTEDKVRVTIGSRPSEIWKSCKPVS